MKIRNLRLLRYLLRIGILASSAFLLLQFSWVKAVEKQHISPPIAPHPGEALVFEDPRVVQVVAQLTENCSHYVQQYKTAKFQKSSDLKNLIDCHQNIIQHLLNGKMAPTDLEEKIKNCLSKKEAHWPENLHKLIQDYDFTPVTKVFSTCSVNQFNACSAFPVSALSASNKIDPFYLLDGKFVQYHPENHYNDILGGDLVTQELNHWFMPNKLNMHSLLVASKINENQIFVTDLTMGAINYYYPSYFEPKENDRIFRTGAHISAIRLEDEILKSYFIDITYKSTATWRAKEGLSAACKCSDKESCLANQFNYQKKIIEYLLQYIRSKNVPTKLQDGREVKPLQYGELICSTFLGNSLMVAVLYRNLEKNGLLSDIKRWIDDNSGDVKAEEFIGALLSNKTFILGHLKGKKELLKQVLGLEPLSPLWEKAWGKALPLDLKNILLKSSLSSCHS